MSGGGGGRVRLIAGALKGRPLAVARGVRPTEGRVREALFSIWGERVGDSVLLDLFAGSGAVGVEALSRGAPRVVFVEGQARVAEALSGALTRMKLTAGCCLALQLPRGLAHPLLLGEAPFDLIFADPPYRFPEYVPLLQGVATLLAPEGEAVVEHAADVELPVEVHSEGRLLVRREVRRYGGTRLSFYCAA